METTHCANVPQNGVHLKIDKSLIIWSGKTNGNEYRSTHIIVLVVYIMDMVPSDRKKIVRYISENPT